MLPSASVLAYRREERVQKAFSGDHHGHGDGRPNRSVQGRKMRPLRWGAQDAQRGGTARVHPDGASNLLMLSVRSCCSSSTTNAHRAAEVCGWSVRLTSCEGDTQAASRREAADGTRMHTDGASNLLVLSVRSCCSSSTTNRRTSGLWTLSVTFRLLFRWRRDGGEMEARRR